MTTITDEAVETAAQQIYDLDPFYEAGEYGEAMTIITPELIEKAATAPRAAGLIKGE